MRRWRYSTRGLVTKGDSFVYSNGFVLLLNNLIMLYILLKLPTMGNFNENLKQDY